MTARLQTLDVAWAINFHYPLPTKVALDNAVRLRELVLDFPPGPYGRSYAKSHLQARQLLNGSWKVYYQNRLIAEHHSTGTHEPLRALPRKRLNAPGGKSYNWVYQASAEPIYDKPFIYTIKAAAVRWVHPRLVGAAAFPL